MTATARTGKLTDFFSSPSTSKSKSFILPRKTLFDLNSDVPSPKRKKFSLDSKDPTQMILDAGQSNLGTQICRECGMVYDANSSVDQIKHDKFHAPHHDINLFAITDNHLDKCKSALFHEQIDMNKIIFCLQSDSKFLVSKASTIIEKIVNKELGFPRDISVFGRYNYCELWICVSRQESKHMISAIMVSEILSQAYWSDTKEPYTNRPIFGVNRIWTHPNARKQGIAQKLIRAGIKKKGCKMFAISEPTEAGRKLAASLSNESNNRFLIYSIKK